MSVNYSVLQNTLWPAATATVQVLRKSSDGILDCMGNAVPNDGLSGYAPSCTFRHIDGSGDNVFYVNEGTATSCNFRSMKNVPNAYGTTTGRGPSPLIWDDCPVLDYMLNPQLGFHAFEDFILGPDVAANNAVSIEGQMTVYTDANTATIKLLTDELVGAVSLAAGATDNEDAAMGFGGATGASYLFSQTAPKAFWLEARLKKTATTTNKLAWFFGMIEEGCYAADGVLADNDMATKDCVGFHQIEADTTTVDTVHDTATGSLTQVKDAAVTIVADTYVKLGMKLDVDSLTLRFYKDGVQLADTVLLSATNFPDGQEMCPLVAIRSVSATTPGDLTVDWMRVAWAF